MDGQNIIRHGHGETMETGAVGQETAIRHPTADR
mgnify:FL=1